MEHIFGNWLTKPKRINFRYSKAEPQITGVDSVTILLTCKLTIASLPFKPGCNGFMALFILSLMEVILYNYYSNSQKLADLV